ncbi:L-fucose mutarotase [Sphaerochaeta sp. PS]|uniref:L-fucose mutarotase n=1 Tax=Sphaerochaeta sp. PS TaxID=3076336 RepID=UPI0028A3145C|nr:L-fucose mutarotase [Sphaerochaeta sp. PS]MDT4761271.1 L-fucose mutarotase [Sphaerochaeta sp. PS]
MLKRIPSILSPELLKVLMEMGHGDELVIGDGNFPASSMNDRVIRLDGHDVPSILEAILQLFPLDTYADNAILMAKVPGDTVETPIWAEYEKIAKKGDPAFTAFTFIDRYAFYDRAKKAYAVVATGEKALYANVLLKKGVVV